MIRRAYRRGRSYRLAAIACLLACGGANALGPEEQEFIGEVDGRAVALHFVADPNVYAGEGSGLGHCRLEGELICEAAQAGGPSTRYLEADEASKGSVSAQAIFRKAYPDQEIGAWNPEGVYYGFFECSEGCSAEVPQRLVLVTHGD